MKKHLKRSIAALLALLMILTVLPAASFATEIGEGASFVDGLPADGSYGTIYSCGEGYSHVIGYDLNEGNAPALDVEPTDDGEAIRSLPEGTMVIRFVKTGDDYYFIVGDKYLVVKDLDSSNREKLVLCDTAEPGAKWTVTADQAGMEGAYNIKNAEYKWNGKYDVYLEQYNGQKFCGYSYPKTPSADNVKHFQFRFLACSADEDGRVGELAEGSVLPENGDKVVIYNEAAAGVFGQQTGPEAPKQNLTVAAATLGEDGTLLYDDIADGALIFAVTVTDGEYTFKTGDKYLGMSENYTDESSGKIVNNESLILCDEESGYTKWTVLEINGGWLIKNKEAQWKGYPVYIECFNDQFCGYTYYAGDDSKYAMNFYKINDKYDCGWVVNPSIELEEPAPAIGSDCTVKFTVKDLNEIKALHCGYSTDVGAVVSADPEMDGKTGSFTVPKEALEGTTTLTVYVGLTDAMDLTVNAQKTVDVADEPLILEVFPEANSATGDEKQPEIGAKIANVGENPTIALMLDGTKIDVTPGDGKISYKPAEALTEGKHSVSLTITRADGKSVTKSWSFFVGEGGAVPYFGLLHSHTAEYSDGAGTLAQAYEHAHEVDDLDYIIITDHSNYFDTTMTATDRSYYDLSSLTMNAAGTMTKWEEARATAASYNALYDDFVCAYGYEMTWSGGPGHYNTFNTYGTLSRNNLSVNNKTNYSGMLYYDTLMFNANRGFDVYGSEKAYAVRNGEGVYGVNATKYIPFDEEGKAVPVVSQFNHPGTTFGTFGDFMGHTGQRDEVLNLIEVGNGEGKVGGSSYFPSYAEYDKALSMGWHVAPTNNQDNHKGNWGDANTCRTVILADALTEAALYQAMAARRVYATEDQNLNISYAMTIGDTRYEMGDDAALNPGEAPDRIRLQLTVSDPDGSDGIASIEIVGADGKTLHRIDGVRDNYFQQEITLDNTDAYYYVRVVEQDGDIAVTAPIWVLAEIPASVSVETDAAVAIQGEEESVLLSFENLSADEPMYLTEYQVIAEEETVYSETLTDKYVAPNSSAAFTVPFTPAKTDPAETKTYDIQARFTFRYKGKEFSLSRTIRQTSYPEEQVIRVGLDSGHKNYYVSGDYANCETSFMQICTENGAICEYIGEGEMTAEKLAGYDLVVITVPRISETVMPPVFTADELAALRDYAYRGGNIINLSKSDRYDYSEIVDGKDSYAYASATLSNSINEAIGANARFVRGIVVDNEKKSNEAYRIYFEGIERVNETHPFTKAVCAASNGQYQWYNGTGVVVEEGKNDAAYLIKPYESTWVASYKDNFTGGAYVPDYDNDTVMARKNEFGLVSYERLAGGGFLVCGGAPFISNYELKTDTPAVQQYMSYRLVLNILEYVKNGNQVIEPEITPIADVHKGEIGQQFTIDGWITSNASDYDKDTAFFDCVYIQDETRGINAFPVSGYYYIGEHVQAHGAVSCYCGEIELNLSPANDGWLRVVGNDKNVIEPAKVSCAEAMSDRAIGNLMQISGTVTAIQRTEGMIDGIYVDDGSGVLGYLFINSYIQKDYTGLDALKVGMQITGVGIGSRDVDLEDTTGNTFLKRLRVRDRSEIRFEDPSAEDAVCYLPTALTIYDPDQLNGAGNPLRAVRFRETNLGDVCADAYREISSADIGWVNGGSVRAELSAGDVMRDDVAKVTPFGNQLVVVEAKGSQILDALEMASRNVKFNGAGELAGETAGFLQVSGLRYTIYAGTPSSVTTDESLMFAGVEGERRVGSVEVWNRAKNAWEPIDPDRSYTLASHDYLLKSGGDGLNMFMDCRILRDDGMLDREVLENYLRSEAFRRQLNSGVYDDWGGEGRITILDESAPAPVDRSALAAAMAIAPAEQGNYTDDSWACLTAALEQANAVWTDPAASQTAVNDAAAALSDAIDNLTEKPTASGGLYCLTAALFDGDQLVIYHPAQGLALNTELSGNKLPGVAVEVSDGVLTPVDGTAIYTVEYADEINFYLWQEDGRYLTSNPTGNGITLEYEPNEYSLWYLEAKDAEAGTVFFHSTNASYDGSNKNQALEYYRGFDTYRWRDTDAYIFQIYALNDGTHPDGHNTEERPGVEPTCTSAGKTPGVWCIDCGKWIEGHEEIPALGHEDADEDRVCDRCGGTVYARVETLTDGDSVLFFSVASGQLMTAEINDNGTRQRMVGTPQESVNGTIAVAADSPAALFTAEKFDDPDYGTVWYLKHDGMYLSAPASSNLTLTETPDDSAKWTVKLLTDGMVGIQSVLTQYDENNTLEYYGGYFTTYWWRDGNNIYYMELYSASAPLPKPCSHDYTATVTAPTCTAPGYTTWTCTLCGDSYVADETPALGEGHSYNAVVTVPTCTESGYTTYTCSRCGDSYIGGKMPALGHSYDAVITAPTCTEDGYTTYACRRCDDSYTVDGLKAFGHSWGEWTETTPAACAEDGVRTHSCSICGVTESETIPATGHFYVVTETAPTCTDIGGTRYTCSTCGDTFVENAIDALGHLWEKPTYEWAENNSTVTATRVCKNDETHVETETVNTASEITKPATCTEKGDTTYTATFENTAFAEQTKTVTNVDATGHTPGEAVEENRVEPTCTEKGGYDTVVYCTVCKAELSREHTELQANGHTPGTAVEENRVEPTCTEKGGYDTVVYCTVCKAELSREHTELQATGHTPGTAVEENRVEPTCTEKGGYDTVTYCTVCKAELSREHTELQATGHTPGEAVEENRVEPTCTEKGGYDTVTYCTVCKAELSRDHTDIPANGHEWNDPTYEWAEDNSSVTATRVCKNNETHVETETVNTSSEITKPATCTEKGDTTYTATFENTAFAEQTKTVTNVDATGHTPGTAVEENRVEPTCTEKGGYDTVVYCTVCKAELSREHTELQATGHTPGTAVEENRVEPTCTEKGGYDTVVCCTVCKAELSREHTELQATGHTPGEAVEENRVEPTCTEKGGYDTVVYCTVCKAELSREHTELQATGHTPGEAVEENRVEPTCTEKGGYDTVVYCTVCKAELSREHTELQATGHTPGEAVEENRVEPTCTEKGGYDTVVYCTVCKAELSREHTDIPATGHEWNEPTYEWAEDNSSVTATRVCKNDETHVETETVNTASEVTKEATVDEEGEITYTAEFTNPAFEKQTKAVAIPKLEPQETPFDDVEEEKFYYDAVLWAVAHEPQITNGTDATHFSPDAICTRGQVVTFLWRAKGCPEPTMTDSPFTDVTGGFYYKAVLWAVENEITNGTSATTFGPNDSCTRGQVVTFLWRAEGKPEPTTENNPFTDVTGGYYYKAVLWAVENGITNGTSATTFSPNATCTRGQIVTFLYRDLASA